MVRDSALNQDLVITFDVMWDEGKASKLEAVTLLASGDNFFVSYAPISMISKKLFHIKVPFADLIAIWELCCKNF